MNGTITTAVKIYFLNGAIAYGAVAGDKVTGEGSVINTLTRNGVQKLNGDYRIATIDAVQWDTVIVPPPVDPPPATTSTITATLTDDETGEVWSGILSKL